MNSQIKKFQHDVYTYYQAHQRTLPWRIPKPDGSFDPYHILVSELMLQQTQVNRVIPKYKLFIHRFPTLQAVSQATLADVLIVWSGLGYNRRARFLHQTAQQIMYEYKAEVPKDIAHLVRLPGIGINTAAAVAVYSFNQAEVFIETNIRTVFLHHFFSKQDQVSDQQLLPLVQEALDDKNPRQWYWALMDYGTYLKQTFPNPSRQSKHYTKQSSFVGSQRFIRGQVIKALTMGGATETALRSNISDHRLSGVLEDLAAEGLISKKGHIYELAK